MNKSEKYRQLLEGKTVEHTLFRPILMHFAARYSGHTYGEFSSDYRVLVESNIKILDDFDIDMVGLISDPYRETAAFGAPVEFIAEGVPRCKKILIRSLEDVKALRNPDVYKAERTLDRINGARYFRKLLNGEVPVIGWIEGPLAEAADLAGVSEMMMFLITDPDLTNMLMDKCVVTAKDFARAQIEAGADVIGMGDAVCSQIDTGSYVAFVKERQKEIIDYIHSLGATVKLHICGDINHLLPEIRDLGVDIIDIDWQVDPDHAHEVLGEKVILCGNINPVDIQDLGEEELEERSSALVRSQTGRRFILSGGCEITVQTPPGNLKAMRRASKP
jgi:MtaA/CmuA family methyltransferase